MSSRSPLSVRRSLTTLAVAGVVAIAVSACGAAATSPATGPAPTAAADNGMGGMSGMSGMATGNGLTGESSGFTFTPVTSALPATKAASFRFRFRFRIQAADGAPVTAFEPDQTKLMHVYLVRSDLTGFQHVHPTMAADGTWTAPLGAAQPGSYRAYASFIVKNTAGAAVPLVLSRPLTVPGASPKPTPLPAAAAGTQVDGYTLKLDTTQVMAGMDNPLTVTVSKNGTPVTDLQPYLDTYAHLTALHEGDLAFAHLHPQGAVNGDHGGPTLSFQADLPTAGNWRLFLQFQTGGVVHTAAVTLTAAKA